MIVRSLFDTAFVLLEYEPSKMQKENLKCFSRKTFKQFMMISKRSSTSLVEEMIGADMDKMAQKLVIECKKQWEERKIKEEITPKAGLEKQNFLRAP